MADILGTALLDYQNNNYTEDIITESTISEADEMPLPYLFRSYKEMPALEQKALQLSKGSVLDIGCDWTDLQDPGESKYRRCSS